MTTIDEFIEGLDIGAAEPFETGDHPADQSAPAASEAAPATSASETEPVTPVQGEADGQGSAASSGEVTAPQPGAAPSPVPPVRTEPTVPVATLVAERKSFQAELEAERRARAELEQRLAKLEKPPEPPKPDPDYLEDPKAYVDAKVQAAVEKLDKVGETATKTAEDISSERQFQAFVGHLQNDEAGFVAKTPDYHDALAHVRQVRTEQLRLMVPGATDEQIVNHLRQEELAFAATQMQAGKSPAEAAYRFARTLGYAGKSPAPALAVPAAQGKPAHAEQAAAAARTLGPSGGEAVPASDPLADGLGDGLDALDMALRERFAR